MKNTLFCYTSLTNLYRDGTCSIHNMHGVFYAVTFL